MSQSTIEITVEHDEALVLFALLSRYSDGDSDSQLAVLDIAERQTLWNVCCLLEPKIAEAFSPDYDTLLATAKKNLTYEGSVAFSKSNDI